MTRPTWPSLTVPYGDTVRTFAPADEVVVGSEVAERLKYEVGTPVVVTHGLRDIGTSNGVKPTRTSPSWTRARFWVISGVWRCTPPTP